MPRDDEIKPVEPIFVRSGETIDWKDETDVFENLESNLRKYLSQYAEKRFTYESHKEIASTILSLLEKINQAAGKHDPLEIVYAFQLLDYVASINIKAKNSFLKAVLSSAKTELEAKREELKERLSNGQRSATKVVGLQRTVGQQADQILKLQTERDGKLNLEQQVRELQDKLSQAERVKHETSQRYQALKEREELREQADREREIARQQEIADQALREKDYAGFREANVSLRQEVAQLAAEKTGIVQELAGARSVKERLIAENETLVKENQAMKPKVMHLEEELKGVRALLEKQKEENFALADENTSLRKAVQKLDEIQTREDVAGERGNKLAAELQKERKNTEKWKNAFSRLLEVLNVLLKKLRREPIALSEDHPEQVVGELKKREEGIRVKPTPEKFFAEPERESRLKK